jgi:hypothetical protein
MTTKISTLPTLATVTAATIVPVVEGGATKKVTAAALATYITGTVVASSVSAATPAALGTVYGKTDTANLVFLGYQAGNSNTSGTQNTAIGIGALQSNVSASYNTAVGYQALNANTGGQNTAVGRQALYLSTGTSGSTAIGVNALYSSTYGTNNVAVGDTAQYLLTTGSGNVAVGNGALYSNATSSNTVAIGNQAMLNANGGLYNTAVGYRALFTQDSYGGESNTAIGYSALLQAKGGAGGIAQGNTAVGAWAGQATTGVGTNNNTFIGAYSGYSNTSGLNNTAVGNSSLYSNTTSANNVAVGYQSLYSVTNATGTHTAVGYQALYSATDNSNTAFGYRAGYGITSGHNNVCLGKDAGNGSVVLTTGAQNVIIGSGAYGSNSANYTEIVIGFGCNGVGGDYVTLGKLNNRVYCHYDTNATWTQSSDVRLKKDIEDDTLGLAFINRLRPVKYRWKATNELEQDNPQYNETNNKNTAAVMHGLIAQEVKAALDAEGVDTFGGWDVEPNGIQGISREMFISPLIKAVQELKALVDAQAARIAQLEGN